MSRHITIQKGAINAQPEFFSIHGFLISDFTLTFEARGFLIFILSFPNDYIFDLADLAVVCQFSKQKLKKIILSLEKRGYAHQYKKNNFKFYHKPFIYDTSQGME